jgi:hypothetical protein
MSKFKCQITNDEVRIPSTDTKLTDTDTYHEHDHDPLTRSSVLIITNTRVNVKLPAHRAGLPGNESSFLFVPLAPLQDGACGGLAGKSSQLEIPGKRENELCAKGNVGK